jgi:hypothetical protein
MLEKETPMGILTAKKSGDTDYPNITIELDGNIVAVVEYSNCTIRTLAYNAAEEEPTIVIFDNCPSAYDENLKEKWWLAGDWIPCPEHNKEDPESFNYFLWDGDFSSEIYSEALKKAYLENGDPEKIYIYSLVEEDGEGYIIGGKRFVNRIGYFLSKKFIEVKNPIRYW